MNRTIRLLIAALAVLAAGLSLGSCRDSQLVDDTEFNIFYPGLTDIGPSMSCDIPLGSYIGAAPSDFAIYNIKFGEETFSDEDGVFSIDATTGTVHIENSDNLEIGQYYLSISCVANGKTWQFPDAIVVNMMKPVPEEIKVEPSEITINMSDVINGYFVPENYAAQIYSDSEAISITSYEISEVTLDGEILNSNTIFTVSDEGVVSMDIDEETTPGVYSLSFKLYTILSGDDPEEGLFQNALTVNLASAPTDIEYPFLPVLVEQDGIARTSETPTVTGSQVDLSFELAGITPEYYGEVASSTYISIDAATGAINIAEGHPFVEGDEFSLDITVTNDNGTTTFTDACQIQVVDEVAEVSGVSYEPVEIVRGQAVRADVIIEAGDNVTYSFENLPDELSELSLNSSTGRITLAQGNSIAEGTYSVNVIARNYKNSVTAAFSLTVGTNPYYFTTVSWGNNLGDNGTMVDDPDYDNQFRYTWGNTEDLPVISIKSHDIPDISQATFSMRRLTNSQGPGFEISNTGDITFHGTRTKTGEAAYAVDIYIVTVTNGAGEAGETVVEIPIFLHSCAPEGVKTIQYTPIVGKVNPRTGGTTHGLEFVGDWSDTDKANFYIDYRRSFNYYNLGGPESHLDGQPGTAGSFMESVWYFYWITTVQHTTNNTGAKGPMSYFDNSGERTNPSAGISPKTLSMALGYINPARDYGVTINPRKFIKDNAWADGLLLGQMTWTIMEDPNATEEQIETAVSGASGEYRILPFVIWFDPDYEN
ncbi:MAG: DUF4958 family protein [Bacteroidetes bacterium]|uniref:DUF4958 family protein n=1 Tax=Candidatus Cryptobacteroides merdigallinarum TaxID=2840770 RepID=A0A9D9HF84_9BACT|nr:DUF4958 family protein [Candidatus Cryptobacteroides merdigallinarum]